MARRASKANGKAQAAAGIDGDLPMDDIRHPIATRRNVPSAKIVAGRTVPVIQRAQYGYNPHLPPVLRETAR